MIIKLIKKAAIFSSLWAVILYVVCLFMPFHYFNAEYPMWLSKMEIMNGQEPYENLLIGDSRVIAGVNPEGLGDNFYNLALGGGTPMEGYYMLKKMVENNKKIDTILVSYAPIHFEQSEMFWDRQLKYQFYDFEDIDEIFNELNTKNEVFWHYDDREAYADSDRSKHIRRAYLTYLKSPLELRTELSKSFLLRGVSNYNVYDEIKTQRGYYDFGKNAFSNDLNVEAKRADFLPKEIIVRSLEKMFVLAKENNITVIYLSLPMNRSSYEALTESYKDGVLTLNKSLKLKHPEVHFTEQEIPYYDDGYFGDASHLNRKGRKKFTLETRARLAADYQNGDHELVTTLLFDN